MNLLSSKYLFHYKKNLAVFTQILKNGFRYNLWDENLPNTERGQQNFIVCFCDIKIEDSNHHRSEYGNNALVLRKEWGIKNGVSPVRYIHKYSPGTGDVYTFNKDIYRAASSHGRVDWIETIYSYLTYTLMRVNRDITPTMNSKELIELKYENEKFIAAEKEILSFINDLNNEILKEKFLNFLHYLTTVIAQLHSELEVRDAFTRVYEETGKILYDEKEWRSYKFITTDEILQKKGLFINAEKVGYLPESYNLRFADDDVVSILVENDQSRLKVIDFLRSENCLLNFESSVNKILLIQDFKE